MPSDRPSAPAAMPSDLPRHHRPTVPTVPAESGMVVEVADSDFCGAIVAIDRSGVVLEDRHGRRRTFPLQAAGFLVDGRLTTLSRPETAPRAPQARSASGSRRVVGAAARTARASRIWVEGLHDAELVERVWGHDLRVEGVVVEPLHGADGLADAVARFGPGPRRRLGVLLDHLVDGSKETRIARSVGTQHVLVVGHPYVDIWQAVRPAVLGIPEWPDVRRGVPWKAGVCAALGWTDEAAGARRVLGAVRSFRDLETPLVGAVERLVDFVTDPG